MIILKIASDTKKLKRKNSIRPDNYSILKNYIPGDSIQIVMNWIDEYKFLLKITKARSSKLGDYRHPFRGKHHQITINNNLNKYLFLITLTHEVAHLTVWNKYKKNVLPHGKEWKEEFKIHMEHFSGLKIFPEDILECINNYSVNPMASSCSDVVLAKVLKKYDEPSEFVHLEDLPVKSIFRLRNGRTFIKGDQIRKRFLCTDLVSKKKFLVSPVAEVMQTSLF